MSPQGPRVEPRLVTFEGIDGSGKSTLVEGVNEALTGRAGVRFEVTREETRTWLGEAVKRAVSEQAFPLATCYLFLADRAEHLNRLAPALRDGRLVLSDRYHDSTRAYQAVTLGPMFGGTEAFEAWLQIQTDPWLLHPVRTFLLDVPADVACGRLAKARDDPTPYEREPFLADVRRHYQRIAADEPERFLVLDGTKAPAALVADVVADLESLGLLAPA